MFAAFAALPLVVLAGNVTGRVRLPAGETIPPVATVQVELRDVSKADAGSMLVGKVELHNGGGKNDAPFEIGYDDKRISSNSAYAVSSRIIAKGRLLYINNVQVPVITRGAPVKDVELPVSKVKR